MRRQMRRRLLLPLLLAAALLGRCDRETPQPAPAQPKNTQQDGGRVVRRLEGALSTLNYILQTQEEERQVLAYLYDPLIALNQNLAPIPGIATRWEVGDGGRSYTLHLDPRATFSDGTPVKASDVVFTLNKIVDEQSMQFAGWFEGLDRKETKAIDDRTVRVTFKEARAAQLLAFNISVVPEHIYGKGEMSKNTQVVGNGPYVLEKHDRGRSVLLRRRKDYWRQKPPIETVFFRVIADDKVAWNALMRGEIDISRVNNDAWSHEKDKPEVQKKMQFFDAWLLSYNCIIWNFDDPLFHDVRVRRALAMAFDRDAVIKSIYHGQARPMSGPFMPDQWAHNNEVVPIEYNPQVASALLSSAGWRDTDADGILDREGKPFAFTLLLPSESAATRDQALVFQNSLQQIGVKVEISPMESASFFERLMGRDFGAAFLAWVVEPDPDPYTQFHSSQIAPAGMNIGGYKSAEADQLIDEARRELDPARRAELYHQLHDVVARDQPYLFTMQIASKWAVNRRVQNVRVSKGLGLFLWYPGPYAWWLK
jgi:peptide/nickel transport system substrate-binding protein